MLQINIYILCIAFVVCVGAVNIYNFMDGINGMTCCYSVSVLIPLIILNLRYEFIEQSFLFVVLLSVLVFCMFNFRQKDKAKCFAGDVGSVGIAFMLLFPIVKLVIKTGDLTWLAMLIVYGVDGCLTICHRMMLHENLGEAHRKHVYQLMANELGLSHITVSCIYMCLQLVISLSMIYFIPNALAWHFVYLVTILMILVAGYVAFIKKYYYLHKGVNK